MSWCVFIISHHHVNTRHDKAKRKIKISSRKKAERKMKSEKCLFLLVVPAVPSMITRRNPLMPKSISPQFYWFSRSIRELYVFVSFRSRCVRVRLCSPCVRAVELPLFSRWEYFSISSTFNEACGWFEWMNFQHIYSTSIFFSPFMLAFRS